MVDAIGEAGVHLLATEVEIGLARMAERPFANSVVEIEQRGLASDFRARTCRDEATRRRGRRIRMPDGAPIDIPVVVIRGASDGPLRGTIAGAAARVVSINGCRTRR